MVREPLLEISRSRMKRNEQENGHERDDASRREEENEPACKSRLEILRGSHRAGCRKVKACSAMRGCERRVGIEIKDSLDENGVATWSVHQRVLLCSTETTLSQLLVHREPFFTILRSQVFRLTLQQPSERPYDVPVAAPPSTIQIRGNGR